MSKPSAFNQFVQAFRATIEQFPDKRTGNNKHYSLAGGDFSEARIHLNQALTTFATIEARLELGRTHLALAELAHARKSPEAAAGYLNEAGEVFRALELPRWVEQTEQLARSLGAGLQR